MRLFTMKITAYMILVATEDLNVLISGLTFLFMQQVHIETPKHDETHEPMMLSGAKGSDNSKPIALLTVSLVFPLPLRISDRRYTSLRNNYLHKN